MRHPIHPTPLGVLFRGDCLEVLASVAPESVHTVFLDPPFNLGKDYGAAIDDSRGDEEYRCWLKARIDCVVRLLVPGGAFFLYNLPRWNVELGGHLSSLGLHFRHWIAVAAKTRLPIPGRLYPAHYSLLYYTKGSPRVFRKIRTPIATCRHCGGEIKDYGGHRKAMHPDGVNLTDIWDDIPPVRHRKFKSASRSANALSTKLVERVIELSTVPGDVVLDPFAGSGTVPYVCERRGRRWIAVEIGDTGPIEARLAGTEVAEHRNTDVVEG
jgi:site-specific DNA-methyltransferase (adenine-specific)